MLFKRIWRGKSTAILCDDTVENQPSHSTLKRLRIFSVQKGGFIEDSYLQQNQSENLKYQGGFNISKQEKALA